jgi:hypothetical protein
MNRDELARAVFDKEMPASETAQFIRDNFPEHECPHWREGVCERPDLCGEQGLDAL